MPEQPAPGTSRFLTLEQVADELNTSQSQVYALVRRKELRAGKIGGRGQWRIARTDLEAWIDRVYAETDTWIDEHPFEAREDEPPSSAGG